MCACVCLCVCVCVCVCVCDITGSTHNCHPSPTHCQQGSKGVHTYAHTHTHSLNVCTGLARIRDKHTHTQLGEEKKKKFSSFLKKCSSSQSQTRHFFVIYLNQPLMSSSKNPEVSISEQNSYVQFIKYKVEFSQKKLRIFDTSKCGTERYHFFVIRSRQFPKDAPCVSYNQRCLLSIQPYHDHSPYF